jgi:hypothetical protein
VTMDIERIDRDMMYDGFKSINYKPADSFTRAQHLQWRLSFSPEAL